MPDRLKIEGEALKRFERDFNRIMTDPECVETDDISYQICVAEMDECTCAACQLEARYKAVRTPR